MPRFLLVIICLYIASCSDKEAGSNNLAVPTSQDKTLNITKSNPNSLKAKRDKALADFGSKHTAPAMDPSHWDPALTAAIQIQYEGMAISIDGWVLDVVRLDDGSFEMTVDFGSSPSFVAKIAMDKQQGLEAVEALHIGSHLYVAAKISKISPVHLVARACDTPDCDEIEVKEQSFGMGIRLNATLIAYELVPET